MNNLIYTQSRNMATLKELSRRLKSVHSIKKITKSMQMVSASKFAKAERDLRHARPYGLGAVAFYEKAEVEVPEAKKTHLIVAMTSDRGLCGAVHSRVIKFIRQAFEKKVDGMETKVVCIGEKARLNLVRQYKDNFLLTINEIGKKDITFGDASKIAGAITNSEYQFDSGEIVYNRFKSALSNSTVPLPIYSLKCITEAKNYGKYDSVDADVIQSFQEFNFTSLVYYTLKENSTSEQSSRMSAMDNATKNASEMIDKLTLLFNRTRQAAITRELIEIMSGAAALEEKQK
ncbi:hypothetical protein SNEBB_006822 [Seison nebaliae]|nr:hypothetical protein SNEBB_006822 [Seison nebaliae]